MLTGDSPPPDRARDFCARWPRVLDERLVWMASQVDLGGAGPGDLDRLVTEVTARLGEEHASTTAPEWYDDALRRVGWSPYGAALAEGLMALVSDIYARRAGEKLPWRMDDDPLSAYHLRPVVDLPGVSAPPWRQVMGSLRQAQQGGDPAHLRRVVEATLQQLETRADEPSAPDPMVVVTPIAADRWQVSFPEDVEVRLGDAYAGLEDALAGVVGVTAAVMEDRDRAVLSTWAGISRANLERRLTLAVEALRT